MKTKICQYVSAIALLGAATVAQAEVTANIAAASNYFFRGLTQTDDGAAVSGGLDYDYGNGISVGTWLSNIDFGGKESSEVDIYGGYGGTYKEVDYGIGGIYYWYPGAGGDEEGGDLDYAEINGSLTWKRVTGSVAYTVWGETDADGAAFVDGDLYYNVSLDVPMEKVTAFKDFSANVFVGYYDFDEADTYTHWGASISKDAGPLGSFSLTYEQTDGGEDDDVATNDSPEFWIGWSKDI
jgi:uncharacterized protein (TIGR02001 family)